MVMSSEEAALQTAIASFYPFLLIGGNLPHMVYYGVNCETVIKQN